MILIYISLMISDIEHCFHNLFGHLYVFLARRSNQSILKEISPDCSLEGLMLKLKLQYFGHLMRRADSFAGKDWRREEKGTTEDEMVGWHHWLNGHELRKLWDMLKDREAWCAALFGTAKSRAWLSDWTELNWTECLPWEMSI